MERHFLPKRLALRWMIEFAGRRPVFGAWSSDVVSTFPYRGNVTIRKVSIQGSDLETGEIRTLASCPGHEWVGVRWKSLASLNFAHMKTNGKGVSPGTIHGLQLVTQLEIATVYVDGRVTLEPNREWRSKK